MKPAPFDYHAPTTVADAVDLLAELDDAKVLAGGQSLVPLMALRLAAPSALVDLRRIEELRGVERRNGGVRIGAATTQTAALNDGGTDAVPLLGRALPFVGHVQIRNRGTIGGSLAHADPAAELPAVAVALDAEFEVHGPNGARSIGADRFFVGTWETAIDDDELLTAVTFPVWEGRSGSAVEEVARRHGDFAIAGACVAVRLDDRGEVDRCAIGLFGLGSVPERARAAETTATTVAPGDIDAAEIGRLAVADLASIPSDMSGSADYRRRVGAVAVERAWRRAVEEATDA